MVFEHFLDQKVVKTPSEKSKKYVRDVFFGKRFQNSLKISAEIRFRKFLHEKNIKTPSGGGKRRGLEVGYEWAISGL